jgi:hypothetical protein
MLQGSPSLIKCDTSGISVLKVRNLTVRNLIRMIMLKGKKIWIKRNFLVS